MHNLLKFPRLVFFHTIFHEIPLHLALQKASEEAIIAYKKISDKCFQPVNFSCEILGKNFCLMFQDEAGFGRTNKPKRCWCSKGVRPGVPCHRVREYEYAYGAVSPADGELFSLILPQCNTDCMNLFLNQLALAYPDDYILLVTDNAAWHKSNGLVVPENIEIFPLLPYTPELNPIEMIWDELREKFFRNELFATLGKVEERLCDGLNYLMKHHDIVASITGWHWIVNSVLKLNQYHAHQRKELYQHYDTT